MTYYLLNIIKLIEIFLFYFSLFLSYKRLFITHYFCIIKQLISLDFILNKTAKEKKIFEMMKTMYSDIMLFIYMNISNNCL